MSELQEILEELYDICDKIQRFRGKSVFIGWTKLEEEKAFAEEIIRPFAEKILPLAQERNYNIDMLLFLTRLFIHLHQHGATKSTLVSTYVEIFEPTHVNTIEDLSEETQKELELLIYKWFGYPG